jgi:flagellar export protein FliJ
MKTRSKLDSVRKVYAEQEKALTEQLARLNREREEQQAQADDLHQMLEGYRQQHSSRAVLSAAEALRFHRFYQRMTDAVGAQEEFVNRLSLAVEGKQAEWQESYRQRRAMELVLEKADAERTITERRRERRGAAPSRNVLRAASGSGAWSMLKDSSEHNES